MVASLKPLGSKEPGHLFCFADAPLIKLETTQLSSPHEHSLARQGTSHTHTRMFPFKKDTGYPFAELVPRRDALNYGLKWLSLIA